MFPNSSSTLVLVFWYLTVRITVKLCVVLLVGARLLSGGVGRAVEAHASAGVFWGHVGAMLSDS